MGEKFRGGASRMYLMLAAASGPSPKPPAASNKLEYIQIQRKPTKEGIANARRIDKYAKETISKKLLYKLRELIKLETNKNRAIGPFYRFVFSNFCC